MKAFLNFLLIVGSAAALLFAFVVFVGDKSGSLGSESPAENVNSNQLIDPYELSKNPYTLKGQGGILRANFMANMADFQSQRQPYDFPYPGMRYSHMIDEHTAIYDVLIAHSTLGEEGGQIAVVLVDGGSRPDAHQPWRVVVTAPTRVVNGFGAERDMATVRFIDYASIPTPAAPKPAIPKPEPEPEAQQPAGEDVTWQPDEHNTVWATGTLRYTGSAIFFQGKEYAAALSVRFTDRQLNRVTELMSPPESIKSAALYQVEIPKGDLPDALQQGCGSRGIKWMMVATATEPGAPTASEPLFSTGRLYVAFAQDIGSSSTAGVPDQAPLCPTQKFVRPIPNPDSTKD